MQHMHAGFNYPRSDTVPYAKHTPTRKLCMHMEGGTSSIPLLRCGECPWAQPPLINAIANMFAVSMMPEE